ncbi:MAG: RecX family transcriptional regulator [Bacteroidia bacterium]|nr:RecX family transcriptional regulator [Bacteroidia bacterium]
MWYKKAAAYCAYQERSQYEVRQKLYALKVPATDAETIIAKLVKDDFLNELRFAITYAGGKFRIKHWGKVKIKMMLKQKQVSAHCINQALNSIENYEATLKQLLQKALDKTGSTTFDKQKTAHAFIAKGFEPDLVWQCFLKFDD